ncbi:Serine/threonine-protein kinase YPK1 [Wickerhamiella sorbophila]|uniref:non-specific serine/threonine protein kinase n=1 Tax=Wickerhamiella sorbophila TaxID=45607 RepID=A0A2T0FI84_9ASCO|nr:Serine/threonine-protein kinase YPK1 [Wickerhamiella sorbophila]PRT54700.1 Serine/threonine-protein kinase YPK1 [Wickerhamiella sorbophila]
MASTWKLTKKLKETHISAAFLRGSSSHNQSPGNSSRSNTLVSGKDARDELTTPRPSVSKAPSSDGSRTVSKESANSASESTMAAATATSKKPSLLRVKIYGSTDLVVPAEVRAALPEWAFDSSTTRPPPIYLVLDYDKNQIVLDAIGGTAESPVWDKTTAFDAASSSPPLKAEIFARTVQHIQEDERDPKLASNRNSSSSLMSAFSTKSNAKTNTMPPSSGTTSIKSIHLGSLLLPTDSSSPSEPVQLKTQQGRNAGSLLIRFEKQATRNQPLTIDDFTLLKVVGKGSFGKVMQVRKKDTQQIYALKTIRKAHIVSRSEVGHTLAERMVLAKINNPFIVPLKFSFQSPEKLYLVLAFVNGGELFHHLQREGRFDLNRARFYTAELLCALECLHEYNVIYRDLKPENILIDYSGHIALCDFGLCKLNMGSEEKTNTFCGTPEYLAPEVLMGQGYTKVVDWWTLGVLFYEMLTGLPPFYDQNTPNMYQKILHDQLTFPSNMDKDARSLLQGLLDRNPKTRLGANGAVEIRAHPFFRQIDWKCLLNKKYAAPFQPSVVSATDTSNFDQEFTNEVPTDSVVDAASVLTASVQQQFGGWSYANEGQLAASGKW